MISFLVILLSLYSLHLKDASLQEAFFLWLFLALPISLLFPKEYDTMLCIDIILIRGHTMRHNTCETYELKLNGRIQTFLTYKLKSDQEILPIEENTLQSKATSYCQAYTTHFLTSHKKGTLYCPAITRGYKARLKDLKNCGYHIKEMGEIILLSYQKQTSPSFFFLTETSLYSYDNGIWNSPLLLSKIIDIKILHKENAFYLLCYTLTADSFLLPIAYEQECAVELASFLMNLLHFLN